MTIQELTRKKVRAGSRALPLDEGGQRSIEEEYKDARRALLECERIQKSLLDVIDAGVFFLNREGKYQHVSERWTQLTGISSDGVLGRDWWQVVAPEEQPRALKEWEGALSDGGCISNDFILKESSGQKVRVKIRIAQPSNIHGSITYVGAIEEIPAGSLAEAGLHKRDVFIDTLLANLPIGVAVRSLDTGGIMRMNDMFSKIYGWKRKDIDRLDDYFDRVFPDALLRRDVRSRMVAEMHASDGRAATWENLATVTASGERRVLTAHTVPITKQNLVINMVQDQTEFKRIEDLIIHLAAHDPQTDLPNRTLFLDRLNYSMAHARRNHQLMAVLLIDLDDFKAINDVYGRPAGDSILLTVAERLRGCLRESDTIARMGGDEFGVLIEGIASARDGYQVAKKILNMISQPYQVDGDNIFVSASIGISAYPTHGDTQHAMIQSADVALQGVKKDGKNGYRLFSDDMAEKSIDRMVLGKQLQRALENREFVIHYQPQVDIKSGTLLGMEALLRWDHPELGLILPCRFLSIAEETGMIIPIGEWVLRTACAQNMAWQKAGLPARRIGVNLSARQLRQKGLVEMVHGILEETGLNPDLLELELTENIVFQNTHETAQLLQDLKDLGVHLAIDDFGAGYTSLSHLARFPFDTLKIDLCFTRKIIAYPSDAAIVAGVIAIANSLHMATVVEGVETQEQLRFFKEQGCSQVQGWLFSPAVPAEEIEARYRELNIAIE